MSSIPVYTSYRNEIPRGKRRRRQLIIIDELQWIKTLHCNACIAYSVTFCTLTCIPDSTYTCKCTDIETLTNYTVKYIKSCLIKANLDSFGVKRVLVQRLSHYLTYQITWNYLQPQILPVDRLDTSSTTPSPTWTRKATSTWRLPSLCRDNNP